MRKNVLFHVDMDKFIKAMNNSIQLGRSNEYIGVVITKLVAYRLRNHGYMGEDYELNVILNTLVKFNKIFDGTKSFTMIDKAPLQVLNYSKTLVNYAAMEERTKIMKESHFKMDKYMQNIDDVSPEAFIVESESEALFHIKHEFRMNGRGIDMYDIL